MCFLYAFGQGENENYFKCDLSNASEIEKLYNVAKEDKYLTDSDFDAALVAKFKALIQTVKEKTDVKGSLEVKYFENSATTVNVKLTNLAELEGVVLHVYNLLVGHLLHELHSQRTLNSELSCLI